MGVYAARVGGPDLVQQILKQQEPHSKFVLNLVGNSVVLEMFDIVRRGGHLRHQPQTFNPMVQMASGIHFSIHISHVLSESDFHSLEPSL